MEKKISIAIDGYGAAGKGETAKGVAKILNYKWIDTGAMYRAVALVLVREGIGPHDEKRILEALETINIDFEYNGETEKFEVLLNGENVESMIRTPEVTKMVGISSHNLDVRKFLIAQQQAMGSQGGVIMDGRDIGEVVLPDAELKILMTADVVERANRRYREFQEKGKDASYDQVLADLKERDALDEKNMSKCADQVLLDTTDMSIEEQVQKVVERVNERL